MDKQRIGFIGLGSMGIGMASRLAESGYDISVFNRTRAKSETLAPLGAHIAGSPAAAAAEADVVMLSLADQYVVEGMLFGEQGVFGSLRPGGYIVDTSTVPPAFARDLAAKAAAAGYQALDACILGNPQHARQGELRVMVGASEPDFHAVEGILQAIGKDIAYLGASGLGATMKLVLNLLMGIQMPALAEAIVFGESAGLPRDKILQMIANSGYASPMMSFRCGIMGRRSFQHAAFKLSLMRKDMMLVLAESEGLGVPMPVAGTAYSMLTAASQQGLGDLDIAAILAFQERLTGMETYPWPIGADGQPVPGVPMTGMGGPPPGIGGRPDGRGGPPPGIGRPPSLSTPPGAAKTSGSAPGVSQ